MTVFRVVQRMAIGGGTLPDAYKWSYVWYADASDTLEAGAAVLDLWENALKAAHTQGCYCYELYASDLVPDTVNFATIPVPSGDQRGTFPLGFESMDNLYTPAVALRVDLLVPTSYASRKWFRLGLREQDVSPGGLGVSNGLFLANIEAVGIFLAASDALCDESGNGFSGITIRGLTGKRLGKFARYQLPVPPSFG